MDVQAAAGRLTGFAGDGIVVGLYEDVGLVGAAAEVDAALDGELKRLLDAGALSAKKNSLTVLHPLGRLPAARVAVVGLGPRETLTLEEIRQATGEVCRRLRGENARRIAADVLGTESGTLDPQQAAEAMVEGAVLGNYRFDRYRTVADEDTGLTALRLFENSGIPLATLQRGIQFGLAKAEATNFARDLVNTGPSDMSPARLAVVARSTAADYGLGCRVLQAAELEAMGARLILAVNRGSEQDCALIVLTYEGGDGPALGLVGKGVCFDSGGLSIKTADGMMTMKGDMSGAAAVLGTIRAVAALNLRLNVTAVIPAVQNLIGAESVKPGDVVVGLAGKSVEILNTDAEGRLILADALTYATRDLRLTPVLDIATLTGACMRALGPVYVGGFSTDEDLLRRVCSVGRQAGEKIWPLPLDDEYGELMKSPIADLRNISTQANGGASSAAMFLREFVGDTPWVHLDIAGQGLTDTEKHYQPKGATGFGVRTLTNFCISVAKQGA